MMKHIHSTRFETFALAYGPALLQALNGAKLPLVKGETREDYALSVTVTMLERLQKYGLQSIDFYLLNTQYGAFKATCAELGIECNNRSIENYLEGK